MLGTLPRFFFYFVISVTVALAAILSLEYHKFVLQRTTFHDQEALRLSLAYKAMATDLRESIVDLHIIASSQILHDYLQDTSVENRSRVEKEFLIFTRNNRKYDQVRFIDASGKEQVRINFDGKVAEAAPLHELQDKSQRYYVQEASRLSENEIYISPLDLNIEAGKVEQPFKPEIRMATPIFGVDSQMQGVIVLNYLAFSLLDNFREHMVDSWGEPMMINPQGYWLSSPHKEDEWGFMLGSNDNFKTRFDKAWDYINSHESGAIETTDGLFVFETVRPYLPNADVDEAPTEEYVAEQYWKIVTRVLPAALEYTPFKLLKSQPVILIALLILTGILSAVLAWLRTQNIVKSRALHESKKRLAEAQRIAHVGNWVWDIPTGALNWSDEIYRIFGYGPKSIDATYEAFLAAVHPDDREMVTRKVNAALHAKTPYVIDHRIVWPDGTIRYVHERGTVQFDDKGQAVRMLGTVQDITEMALSARSLQISESRYQNLFNNMVDGYALQEAILDSNGKPCDFRYLEVNPAFERILGLKRDQVLGKTVLEILPDTEPYWLELFGEVATTGQPGRLEHYGQSFDRYFEIAATCPEHGLVAVFFADVTERKRAERQLHKYREHLEEMVAQRTAALEASNKELETFSYSIAHDLRTPLRSITSFSQILQEEAGDQLTDEQREDLQRIINSGKYMASLIDDILELARISQAEFSLETIDLSKLAQTISSNLEQLSPQRSVKVDITPNLKCRGDARLLRIVLENLLSNAWKYTSKIPEACIEFGVTTIDNENVYYVRDNGVGFDMQYAHKLFTPFGRLHDVKEFEGTGIGLVSVQSAIKRHNGKVWGQSEKGEGSTFYFTLHVFQSEESAVAV